MDVILTPAEARVLGCLIEKSITTPEYYPLTLNALVAACNQKSNRDPVMEMDESSVQKAVDALHYNRHLVHLVTQAGSRVPKLKHQFLTTFELSPAELAVMCELLLRGAQTAGELRARAQRMHPFESLDEIVQALDVMRNWEGGSLVTQIPAGPGRREPRFMQLLCGDAVPEDSAPASEAAATAPASPAPAERVAALEKEVAALRAELEAVRVDLQQFKARLE